MTCARSWAWPRSPGCSWLPLPDTNKFIKGLKVSFPSLLNALIYSSFKSIPFPAFYPCSPRLLGFAMLDVCYNHVLR